MIAPIFPNVLSFREDGWSERRLGLGSVLKPAPNA